MGRSICRQRLWKLLAVFGSFLTGWLVAIMIYPERLCKLTKTTELNLPSVYTGNHFDDVSRPINKRLAKAMDKITEMESILRHNGLLPDKSHETLSKIKLTRDFDLNKAKPQLEKDVTVLIHSFNEPTTCLQQRVDSIVKEYPQAKVIVSSNLEKPYDFVTYNLTFHPNIATEGSALDLMTSQVTSKYFLFLSSGVIVSPHDKDTSIGWLYHALQTITELDFVGGSFLREEKIPMSKYPWLEIPCHRLRLCKWTFSQSMEYRYSVGDMMICEETSQSFLGRVASLTKVPGGFDKTLTTMATTDFFLRAKDKAVVGLRPEVFFYVSKTCAVSPLSQAVRADQSLTFMQKHQLYRLKDSFGVITRAKDSSKIKQLNSDVVHWKDDTFADPDFIHGLEYNLKVADDFFNSKNITYFIDGGVALGAAKLRNILPWDSGDIDTGFFGNWEKVKDQLEQYCRDHKIKAKVNTHPMSPSAKELMLFAGDSGVNTMFPHEPKPVTRDMFMDMYINGRRYPVSQGVFNSFRHYYGMTYLEMYGFSGRRMQCKKPGHHACVPTEFSSGGGHWRDYYCQL